MKTFIYISPDIENPFFATFGALLQRRLTRAGSSLIVYNSDNSVADELNHIDACAEEARHDRIAGLVFISSGENLESYAKLESLVKERGGASNFPVIVVDREISNADAYTCNILCDNYKGVEIGIKLLKDYGHEKIGFVTGALNTDPGKVRLAAFREYINSFDLTSKESWTLTGDFTFGSGAKAGRKIADLQPRDRPTAVFCSNDLCAAGLIQQLQKLNIRVPQDISVLGFDGSPLSKWLSPALTTISQPLEQMAEIAEYALSLDPKSEPSDGEIGQKPKFKTIQWVEPSLTIRQSVHDLMTEQ